MASEVGTFVEFIVQAWWFVQKLMDRDRKFAVRLKLCLSLAVLLIAESATAQSNLFLGWNIQAAVGYQSIAPALNTYSSSSSAYTTSQGSKGIPLFISGGYSWPVSERQVLGWSYERNLFNTKPGSQTHYTDSSLTSSMGFKNQAQLSLVWGQLIRNGSMVYGKAGYASMETTNADSNFSMDGYGLGAGYKTFLNPFQYVFAEYNYTRMTDQTVTSGANSFNASSKGHGVLMGLGWQF
jgi:hypothetical protein